MLYPESPDKIFSGADGRFAVPADAFVNGYGNEPDIIPGTQEAVQDEEEGGAVLAAAQGNRHAVARYDLPL
jgi:hypothetical protein